jgi:peptide/nickel transport system permease protein
MGGMRKYLIKRFSIMLVSLFVMSFVSFVIIELPPGDYLSMTINQLRLRGEKVDEARIAALEVQYGYGQPFVVRYFKWIAGIVTRGDFGRSWQWEASVVSLILERLPFTVILSLSAMLFTYIVSIPIGIYSATHQYSVGDYIATFIGFVGVAIPPFLLALFVMYQLFVSFGFAAGGLFSMAYRDAPWSWDKFIDLLQHLLVPMIVTGLAGTAGNIRTIRATLLDELGKDYVQTARVRGLSEGKLLMKYPVRVALNPLWSSIATLLPAIISGSTIVDVVLNMPTIGPLLLASLKAQDMYLAGSLVLILTFLTLVGTFLSDIVLAISDPRIRYD